MAALFDPVRTGRDFLGNILKNVADPRSGSTGDNDVAPRSYNDARYQGVNDRLDDIAGLTPTDGLFIVGDGTNFVGKSGNDARTGIGLGSGNSPTFQSLTITKDIVFGGESLRAVSETVSIGSNWQNFNSDYSANAAQAGGLVFNYLPTATQTTTSGAGVFTAGVDGASNPTVTVADSTGFAQGDIIEIKGSANNDGRYEVHAASGNTLTIRSTAAGITDQVELFSLGQFEAGTDTGATITKITVAVLRCNTDGTFSVASGSSTGMTYRALLHTGSDVSSQPVTMTPSNYTPTGATVVGQLEGIDAALASIAIPHEDTFDATTDWGSADGDGTYTITIDATTHGKGTDVTVIVQEDDGTEYIEANASCRVSHVKSTGDVKIRVVGSSARFAGRYIIKAN